MKKVINGIVSAVCAVVLVLGCAGNHPGLDDKCQPKWADTYFKKDKEGVWMHGYGTSKRHNYQDAKEESEYNAMEDIAKRMSNRMTTMGNKSKKFMGLPSEVADQIIHNASAAMSEVVDLRMVQVVKREIVCNTMHTLVRANLDPSIKERVLQAVLAKMKNGEREKEHSEMVKPLKELLNKYFE